MPPNTDLPVPWPSARGQGAYVPGRSSLRDRIFNRVVAFALVLGHFIITPTDAIARSLLERLLVSIADQYAHENWNINANIAENFGDIGMGMRLLAPGDKVVIGYSTAGSPVEAIASENGILVTKLQADALQSGLAAGRYPAGSLLYALPLGAQLSLYQAAEDGRALTSAQELLSTRIDGRITTLMHSTLPADRVEVASIFSGVNFADIGYMTSTALGAVNSGELVAAVRRESAVGPIGVQVELLKAQIAQGRDVGIDVAITNSMQAVSSRTSELGGSPDSAILELNFAGNEMGVTAEIVNQVSGVSLSVNSLVSTAIGSINAGIVGR